MIWALGNDVQHILVQSLFSNRDGAKKAHKGNASGFNTLWWRWWRIVDWWRRWRQRVQPECCCNPKSPWQLTSPIERPPAVVSELICGQKLSRSNVSLILHEEYLISYFAPGLTIVNDTRSFICSDCQKLTAVILEKRRENPINFNNFDDIFLGGARIAERWTLLGIEQAKHSTPENDWNNGLEKR